jgi:hypothetical protein
MVQEDIDYAPDDRDSTTLPPVSIWEMERYAYLEDDFDAYLGKTMETTTFFPVAASENCTLQLFVSGPWTYSGRSKFATIVFWLPSTVNLDELQDRLDPISVIDRKDRVLSLAGGLPFHPLTPLSSQGVFSSCVIHVRGRLRGGSSGDGVGDTPENALGGTPIQQGAPESGRGSPFSAFMSRRSVGAPSAIRASPILPAPCGTLRSPLDGEAPSLPLRDQLTISRLVAVGEQARAEGGMGIDPRLLLEDSSFRHRIAQRQRNPRRRDSDYVLAFQQPPVGAKQSGRAANAAARSEPHCLGGPWIIRSI